MTSPSIANVPTFHLVFSQKHIDDAIVDRQGCNLPFFRRMAKEVQSEVHGALMASRGAFVMTGVFSFFINLLMLTAPLYMLQVYDRVLASRSESTLIALTIVAVAMLVVMGMLEAIRSRILVRVGARLDAQLGARVYSANFVQSLRALGSQPSQPLHDLDSLRQFLTGPGPLALYDSPWVPFYLVVVFLFHPILGFIALAGSVLLFTIAILNEILTREPLQQANTEVASANAFVGLSLRNAEVIEALGMVDRLRARWIGQRGRGLTHQAVASDRAGALTASSKAIRMSLQVAILGAGAALAIRQSITPGIMIAAAIIMGRALAPVEQAIGHWRGFIAARSSYARLKKLLEASPPEAPRTKLPAPEGELMVERLVAVPPGAPKPVLNGITFRLEAGDSLGVIGPSASGKSTLARLLVGVWSPAGGTVRLDGAELRTWPRADLGPYIGYLPQDVELFDGTVGENISRFAESPSAEEIVLAARRAGVHDMILHLPEGYDTRIGADGSVLSGGQRQRLALARALYGEPVLVVLDEPNSNLDADGDQALTQAILDLVRRRTTVVVMAHRPSAIAGVNKLMLLKDGKVGAFGPKEQVLAEVTRVQPATKARPTASGANVAPLRSPTGS